LFVWTEKKKKEGREGKRAIHLRNTTKKKKELTHPESHLACENVERKGCKAAVSLLVREGKKGKGGLLFYVRSGEDVWGNFFRPHRSVKEGKF